MESDLTTDANAAAVRQREGKQAELESSSATADWERLPQSPLSERLATLEREVELGVRDARTLVAIPADLARAAKVTFPEDAFGKPEPW